MCSLALAWLFLLIRSSLRVQTSTKRAKQKINTVPYDIHNILVSVELHPPPLYYSHFYSSCIFVLRTFVENTKQDGISGDALSFSFSFFFSLVVTDCMDFISIAYFFSYIILNTSISSFLSISLITLLLTTFILFDFPFSSIKKAFPTSMRAKARPLKGNRVMESEGVPLFMPVPASSVLHSPTPTETTTTNTLYHGRDLFTLHISTTTTQQQQKNQTDVPPYYIE
eukprot:gene7395-5207_t